jgi:phospholipid/cholesterol/gamma-HCH transport system permease protein
LKSIRRQKALFGRHTLADAGLGDGATRRPLWPLKTIAEIGAVAILFVRTFKLLVTAKTDKGDTIRLAYRYTNRSLIFVMVAMAFVGMIMVYQSTEQLSRAVGDTHLVGPAFLKLLIRVLGPTIVGMLIACRVGAGIAAELGAMSVTEQLDAMRLSAADPIEVLMVPRVRAGIVSSLTLVIIGAGASAAAGFATGWVMYGMSNAVFWNFNFVSFPDLVQGLVKAGVYGVVIPIVSGAFGFAAAGGARGVGQATTDAVVGASFAIVLFDSLISLIGYLVSGA